MERSRAVPRCMRLTNHVDPCLIELSPQSGIEHWLKISAAESQPKTRVRIPSHPHTHTMIQHFKHICMHTYIYPYIDLVGPPVQGHVTEVTVRILLQHVSAGPGACCGPLQRVSSSSCRDGDAMFILTHFPGLVLTTIPSLSK